jgi:hypothetical protein
MATRIGEGILDVLVPAEMDPVLGIAKVVTLVLAMEGRGRPARVPTRVITWARKGEHNMYTLQSPVEVVDGMTALLNGRKDVRVGPNPVFPVTGVALGERGRQVPLRVVDISRSGICVEIQCGDEGPILDQPGPVPLRLSLDIDQPPILVFARLKRRWLHGKQLRLSFVFDRKRRGEQAVTAEQALHQYIHLRQVEMIQAMRRLEEVIAETKLPAA